MQSTGIHPDLTWLAHHRWFKGDSLSSDTSASFTIWIVLDGTMGIETTSEAFQIAAGDICVVPPRQKRTVTAIAEAEWISLGLAFSPVGEYALLASRRKAHIWQPTNADQAKILSLVSAIREEYMQGPSSAATTYAELDTANLLAMNSFKPDACAASIVRSLATAIYALCQRAMLASEPQAPNGTAPWLLATLADVQRDPSLTVADLIRRAPVSSAQLRREFHRATGLSPLAYIAGVRLDAARRMLVETDATIEVVADRIGFESPAHFARLFKRTQGCTPGEYRKAAAQPVI